MSKTINFKTSKILEIQSKFYNFVKFGFISIGGLTIDLTLFYLLTSFNTNIFYSNFISSFCGVLFVYAISIKVMFYEKFRLNKFFHTLIYYTCSIAFFSVIIHLLVQYLGILKLSAKIIVIPFSFIVNYFSCSKILKTKALPT